MSGQGRQTRDDTYSPRAVLLALAVLLILVFGGFGPDFYAAYAADWPLDAGAAARTELYNL